MTLELMHPGDKEPGAPENGEADQTLSPTFVSLSRALEVARSKLLDRSLRNKLISTNLASTRARQVRVFDEHSDQIFQLLQSGKNATFAPAMRRGEAETEDRDAGPDRLSWAPPDEDPDDTGAMPRHRDNKLQTKLTGEGLQKRLTSLLYEGQTIEEEQGVSVLYLALGFLEWREAKQSEIARHAPLILLPVEIVRDGARDRFKLRSRQEDLYTNVSLQAWLGEQFGIDLPELPDQDEWMPSAYFDQVAAAVGQRPGWTVHANEIVLGFFSFSKFLMWRDLDPANWPDPTGLVEHPLLKSILLRDDGDEIVDEPLVGEGQRVDEVFTPAELVHVTDADSSQAIAIQEAMAGKNLVIQGPPGTGKSQTITNIIAGAVQRGKRVLFIAEKMAALEVVHQRLVDRKLASICLELHSRKASKAQVIEQIRQARAAATPPSWPHGAFGDLGETQSSLRAHADRMHVRGSDGLSAFDVIGSISLVKARGAPAPTFTLPAAADWNVDYIKAVTRRASQLGARVNSAGIPSKHPWRGIGCAPPDMLEQERLRPQVIAARNAVEALSREASAAQVMLAPSSPETTKNLYIWAAALDHIALRPTAADALLVRNELVDMRTELMALAADGERLLAIRSTLADRIRPDAWNSDWSQTRRIVAGEGQSLFRMFSRRYRDALADLRGAWVGKFPNAHQARLSAIDELIDGINLAKNISDQKVAALALGPLWNGEHTDWTLLRAALTWLQRCEAFAPAITLTNSGRLVDTVRAKSLAANLRQTLALVDGTMLALASTVRLDEAVAFDDTGRGDVVLHDLQAVTDRWDSHFGDIVQWPPLRDDLAWLSDIGCAEFAAQVFDGSIDHAHVGDVLLLAIYEAKWARLRNAVPEIETTSGDDLNELVSRYRKADLDRIRIAADEVARAHIDRHPTGSAGAVGILNDETRKSRNLKPVRKLMEQAGEAVQRFKPVFLMSPLSVAQYLAPGQLEFDLLVIDEASQIRPEDAIGAIARCHQLVVVGDDKQLPPTNFFNRMINDGEEDEDADEQLPEGAPRRAGLKDIESILNLCSRFPERMLRWHYRSEHPALIAISNRSFYRNQLLLPPSVLTKVTDGECGLVFHRTAEGGYDRGKTARNEIEAEDVAQAALKHARETPQLSLGIGAFSVAQRDCIRDRLDHLCRLNPELDNFVKGRPPAEGAKTGAEIREPVFVKNLENIQGDERDVIFISIGYGKDKDGRMYQSFGPVGLEGGERRLNVLITRARKRCEVFSSIVAEDIRLDGVGKPGVVALKDFLKLAKDGYIDMPLATGRGFDSDFEEAVASAITELGYQYHPQVGMAGFFVDIGVIDPRNPDIYLLGVECDGAAYHSSMYARDRDRLRQMILEKRGWKLHRIWSTDWFYRREREVAKLRKAIEAALAGHQAPTAAHMFDYKQFAPFAGDSIDSGLADGVTENSAEYEFEPEIRHAEGLEPYEYANFRVFGGRAVEPHTLSDGQLAAIVARIVKVEQPIHVEEVGRRLAHACGQQRAGRRIQEAAVRGLHSARHARMVQVHGQFWSEDWAVQVKPRSRALLASNDMVRKPELISSAEFAAAVVIALRQNMALARPDLIVEAARLLGFARTGKDVTAAIDEAISLELDREIERDHLDRVKLRPGSPYGNQ